MRKFFLTLSILSLLGGCSVFSTELSPTKQAPRIVLSQSTYVKQFDFVLFEKYNAKLRKHQSLEKISFEGRQFVHNGVVLSKKDIQTVFAGEYGGKAVLGIRIEKRRYQKFVDAVRKNKSDILSIRFNSEVLFADRVSNLRYADGVIFLAMPDLEYAYKLANIIRRKN